MSSHLVEVILHGPEGVVVRKTYETNATGAKELTSRIDRGVASHRILEGIESQESEDAGRKTEAEKILAAGKKAKGAK